MLERSASIFEGRELEAFPLEQIVSRLLAKSPLIELQGVDLDCLAYLVTTFQTKTKRPCVVVTPSESEARRVVGDLSFFTGNGRAVVHLPSVDASPYGHLSPDRGAVMALLAGQARLAWEDVPFVVISASSLGRRAIPPKVLRAHSHLAVVGQTLERANCLKMLAEAGYHAVSSVEDPGTFAVRGAILDVFPPHLERPVRIEVAYGDEVESLRYFNPENQRTTDEVGDSILLPPVREELFTEACRDRARKGVLAAAAEVGLPTRKIQPVLEDLSHGIPFLGIEGFRPAFHEQLVPLTTYLPKGAVTFVLDPMGVGERLRERWEGLVSGFEAAKTQVIPALPPALHALNPTEATKLLTEGATVRAHVLQVDESGVTMEGPAEAITFKVPNNRDLALKLEQARGEREPLRPLVDAARLWIEGGARLVLSCRQATQLDRLERLLKGYGVKVERGVEVNPELFGPPKPTEAGAVLVQGDASGGFRLLSRGFALVTEEELFGRKAPRKRARVADTDNPFVKSFRELNPDDLVVHVDHGIGRYVGLKKLVLGGVESDFLVVEFAAADKLYLPVYKLGRLQKYVGQSEGGPKLDRLGGTSWAKVQSKARISAEEDALVLLGLYARRELADGYAFTPPDDYFRSFEATFPFEETPDQERAIDEVLADMGRSRPMDRLLCGDVGFGKTEVALRAAMKAIVDGKQVAILVPTTVLALQHFETFKQRFSQYPVQIALLSRTVSDVETKAMLADLARGRVDIVIGTHRILSKDVVFRDLGLLVLDEEHRFGVKDKERLKEVRANVDVLSMTATPIPRTLQLSLGGIRDLSVIATPPHDRLSVRTHVCRATDQVVRDAILRELSRGGQVFFVHNRVHSIDARRAWLTALVPEARIVVGHGQMEPKALEKVMVDFVEGRYNVLLSTTIIESGIDISAANTMLVDHADQLGLAQLYQLRGRVGRGRERGYCYLLVPSESTLHPDARKRLSVISQFTELGSGFQVASHDMELRGAGELLGTRQRGHVHAVGLDLYAQLLEEAVHKLRGEPQPVEFDPEINLDVTALIPDDYCPDTHLRLVFYKRLANARDEDEVLSVAEEIADRLGPLPGPVDNLIEVMRIRTLARYVGLDAVEGRGEALKLTFNPKTPLPPQAVFELVTAPGSLYRAPADYRLVRLFSPEERRVSLTSTRICLQRLAEFVTEQADRNAGAIAP